MSEEVQWHPEAALAVFLLMSVLFAVAGLPKLSGIIEVELGIFEYSINSHLGNALWVVVSLLLALLFAYLLRNRLRNR